MNVPRLFCIGVAASIALAIATSAVVAQRGVGEQTGVARMPTKPEIVTLSGKLTAINVGPCEHTTGRAQVGVHLIVEPTAQSIEGTATAKVEPLNIHVGPANVVEEMLTKFPVGTQLTIAAFRTEKMPANQYVAQSLKSDSTTVTLRDSRYDRCGPTLADLMARGCKGAVPASAAAMVMATATEITAATATVRPTARGD